MKCLWCYLHTKLTGETDASLIEELNFRQIEFLIFLRKLREPFLVEHSSTKLPITTEDKCSIFADPEYNPNQEKLPPIFISEFKQLIQLKMLQVIIKFDEPTEVTIDWRVHKIEVPLRVYEELMIEE